MLVDYFEFSFQICRRIGNQGLLLLKFYLNAMRYCEIPFEYCQCGMPITHTGKGVTQKIGYRSLEFTGELELKIYIWKSSIYNWYLKPCIWVRSSRTVLSNLFHVTAHIENNICMLEEGIRQSCLKLEVMPQNLQESHLGKFCNVCVNWLGQQQKGVHGHFNIETSLSRRQSHTRD